jgi:two-component system, OmpR family, phosphate regulon sensor histidine kinase PhoR
MKVKLSLQRRVVTGCALVTICSLILVGWVLEGSMREFLVGQMRDSLMLHLAVLREMMKEDRMDVASSEAMDALADRMGEQLGMRVTIISAQGQVVGDSEVTGSDLPSLESHAGRPEVMESLAKGAGWDIRYSRTLHEDLLYVARLLGDPAAPEAVLRLAIPLEDVTRAVSRGRHLIALACLVGFVLSLGVAYLVGRGISRQVKDLTVMARRMTSGDLSHRVGRYSLHEVGELARAFDQMADHLQDEMEEVTAARDRMDAILGGMVEGVLLTDGTGRTLLVNRTFRTLIDRGLDPIGRSPAEILRHADLQEAIQRVLRGEPPVSLEIRTLGPVARTLDVHVASLAGSKGGEGAVAVFHDVTEKKRLEQIRRDFVANVSHELRTPLTAMRGSVETLLNGALEDPPHARQFAEMIQRHVLRLQRILEDLLSLARLESGKAQQPHESIRLAELAGSALNAVGDLAASRGVVLLSHLPEPEARVQGDRRQLEQALVNLLDNAIKYTDAGGQVTLALGQQGEEVHLGVSDTGIGISSEHLSRIFERFYRVDKARSREMGGTGLGLSIVKHIAQTYGGRVEVESTPGRGSTFRIVLPAAA